jgi:HlyD family secretion protein
MAKMIKILIALLVLAGLAFGGYSWFKGRNKDDDGVTLVDVTRGAITEKAVAVGQIEPRFKYEVKSKISGIVQKTLVQVGDRVAAGDALFEIAPDPTPSELVEAERRADSAQAGVNRAEADWTRSSELLRQGIVAQEAVDARREAFEQAKIELQGAQDNLELIRKGRIAGRGRQMESIIRAPAAGIVLAREVDPGDPVVPLTSYQEGTVMATIADMSDLVFKGTVDEIDVGKLAVGVPARLNIGALPSEKVTGRLARIAPQAKEEEGARLFEVEIELDPPENPEMVLRAGYSSTADLVIREKTEILLIPERLVLFENDGADKFVEIPAADPKVEPTKVKIETGLSDGLNIEVVSGLAEGDKILQRPPREIF